MSDQPANGQAKPQAEVQPPAIQWDASTIKNSYANVCNLSITQEEVVLNFGLNQAWERESRDVQVQLTNRIILSPFATKRLALLLGAVVQQYETQFSVLGLTATAVGAASKERERDGKGR